MCLKLKVQYIANCLRLKRNDILQAIVARLSEKVHRHLLTMKANMRAIAIFSNHRQPFFTTIRNHNFFANKGNNDELYNDAPMNAFRVYSRTGRRSVCVANRGLQAVVRMPYKITRRGAMRVW